MAYSLYRLLRQAERFLEKAGIPDARYASETLLCLSLGFSRPSALYVRSVDISRSHLRHFIRNVRRRAAGYPLQYITGRGGFRNLELRVGEGVLIPRPETETVVQYCLESLSGIEHPRILDIGTGSGNIAIAVSQECPGCRVVSVDVSPQALAYARENARTARLCGDVYFIAGDCFQPVRPACDFDCIVSNPPYIRRGDMSELPPEVRHEPRTALDGGSDGLDFYRRICRDAFRFLRPGGQLICEIGSDQAHDVLALLHGSGCSDCAVHHDLTGRDRIITARKPLQEQSGS